MLTRVRNKKNKETGKENKSDGDVNIPLECSRKQRVVQDRAVSSKASYCLCSSRVRATREVGLVSHP